MFLHLLQVFLQQQVVLTELTFLKHAHRESQIILILKSDIRYCTAVTVTKTSVIIKQKL